MKILSFMQTTIFFFIGTIVVTGASFQNLDFEATTLPTNGLPSLQPIGVALPGWRASIGANEETSVLYNEQTLGAAFVGLSGTSFPVLQDSFSVLLSAGAGAEQGAVTLWQEGYIPTDAQSLRFLGVVSGPQATPLNDRLGFFVNGQQIPVTDAFSEPGSYNYSADVSAFAGQDVTLGFASFHSAQFRNSLILDGIFFSPVPVPEPSTFALFAVGGVLGWFYWRGKRR